MAVVWVGLLILKIKKHIYKQGKEIQQILFLEQPLLGENILPDFELNLKEII